MEVKEGPLLFCVHVPAWSGAWQAEGTPSWEGVGGTVSGLFKPMRLKQASLFFITEEILG